MFGLKWFPIALLVILHHLTVYAATTHQITNWSRNAGDHGTLTIELGDSVKWSWGDSATQSVQTDDSSLSGFGSGFRSGS